MLRSIVHVTRRLPALLVTALLANGPARPRWRDESGQTSAEYALVVLGAASVALLVALWARNTDQVGSLLDTIFGGISRMARG